MESIKEYFNELKDVYCLRRDNYLETKKNLQACLEIAIPNYKIIIVDPDYFDNENYLFVIHCVDKKESLKYVSYKVYDDKIERDEMFSTVRDFNLDNKINTFIRG